MSACSFEILLKSIDPIDQAWSSVPMESKNVHCISSHAVPLLLLKMRDIKTSNEAFKRYADRLMRIVAEEGLAFVSRWIQPRRVEQIKTPTGAIVSLDTPKPNNNRVCVVSIIRAGDALLQAVLACEPGLAVGKILIQRDETTIEKTPRLYYAKLPPNVIQYDIVVIVDPMLATGGSVLLAIETLLEAGVTSDKIVFLNIITCPEGLSAVSAHFPDLHIVTAVIDTGLNEEKYIVPGLGDFGDRYFNTTS